MSKHGCGNAPVASTDAETLLLLPARRRRVAWRRWVKGKPVLLHGCGNAPALGSEGLAPTDRACKGTYGRTAEKRRGRGQVPGTYGRGVKPWVEVEQNAHDWCLPKKEEKQFWLAPGGHSEQGGYNIFDPKSLFPLAPTSGHVGTFAHPQPPLPTQLTKQRPPLLAITPPCQTIAVPATRRRPSHL